jgi:RNA polymerase sigma-70 factor (TIGR02957 family)
MSGMRGRSDHARARVSATRVTGEERPVSTSELLDDLRPRVFAIAYRMLGSVSEAEDVVQETLLRVHSAIEAGEEISSPRAYAATVATRIAIDELRSARARRETYVGEWLPEPITERPEDDPARQAELADSLSLAFLVVLESLSPEQRAAFLLHDVFDYDYDRVAEIVGTSEANARQLASRARRHVDQGRTRFDASEERRNELATNFFAAVENGDFEGLEALLAEDVELHGDGGGMAPAIRHPVFGRAKAAQMLRNWGRLAERIGGLQLRRVTVNGQPGAEFLDSDGKLINVLALDIADGQIQTIRSIVNPEKLGHLGPVADTKTLFARVRGED